MSFLEKPVRLAVVALALTLAACGEKAAESPPAEQAAAPSVSVKAGDASVETSDTGTVVRAGDVSVSISNTR
ncbi:hypothetical protein [Cupriavidus sp.]|jgi:predicted small lipoprotein YifL|uniref:hypothetical protein n=1 Tax=Cupriavidus sp. TaxID=1873897 RepID=UPI0025BBED0F|nr:hypothetical protein [Cupriavidus sp.]MCA3183286.1 hypothetical protein [Cupriavidus sp.]MCA3191937.1 hypothetical protein [Cupriavidus sp.]MCA3197682.1 hypothetical protein [Cupriavidus sp.]MCA3202734.1 hypothetical protein [Cupriavidus sp.]MCA3209100.1 hypothetical protein [Cupriavidus sp.]